MNRPSFPTVETLLLALVLVAAAQALAAGQDCEVRYAPVPNAASAVGVPREALAQRMPHFEDRGPIRDLLRPDKIMRVDVRRYDGAAFAGIDVVRAHLCTVMNSAKGSSAAHVPWAERLPAPSIEARIVYKNGDDARWLLWPNRSVLRDARRRWWFSYGF